VRMAKGSGSIAEIRKKVTKTHEFISTSYHEAGHTIYGLLHLMKVTSVSVFENKKIKRIHGLTCYDYPIELDEIQDPDLLNTLAKCEVGISYAGLIAEKTLFRSISGSRQTPTFISYGSHEDNKSARAVIKKYNLAPPGPKRTAYKQKLSREVQNELHTHWDAVMIVSHALFKHRRLSYADLFELLTKKTNNKKFWKDQFKRINYFYDNSSSLDEKDLKSILSK
jgi:ATP-dependent Zn protease